MQLVEYSDSESDKEMGESHRQAKKPRHNPSSNLPPLPATFRDLYATNSRVSVQDDPSLHGGRKRAIPHVEGNWPTHIYLEWYPSKGDLIVVEDLLAKVSWGNAKSDEIKSLLHSDLGVQLPLHISLSRSVVLRTEQRSSFIEELERKIKESGTSPFHVQPDALKWVSNYERTRWFLVLHVAKPKQDNLNKLLSLSNHVLGKFNQPPLYTTQQGSKQCPSDYSEFFHISIAWRLTEPEEEELKRVQEIHAPNLFKLHINFDCVKAKVGNNVASVLLPGST
ncbi:hypothetical protein N7468_005072 [Penicillium chermesinum]|uniref:U6 snRNA phosphodiesterase n=1 Tax=Penicillium chermesinum TaxID=63820 RepID=A0A9W9TMM2_9EURO|nr:uncharacterized protein N7468_005072 [Penicillium chermesinum]KAJ5232116.1 hypothetical protein N7468_005072 [Penicillium chermesinum]KAJ6171781.1 hypothetical protein N7470_000848 [Penicillium chermesinum]